MTRSSLVLLAALAASLATGCVSPPGPIHERPELATIRARVGDARAEHLVVEMAAGATTPASAGERIAPVAPDPTRAGHAVRDAVKALRLFDNVTNGGETVDGAARLEIQPVTATARYQKMDAWWPASFVAWSFGGPLGLLVPDEDWAVDLAWDVRLVSPDGSEVASTRIERSFERALNDVDRGWSWWDLFIYYATPITPERLDRVGQLLLPHAEQDAAIAVCEWLVDEAAAQLPAAAIPDEPEVPEDPPEDPTPVPPVTPTTRSPRTRILCIGVRVYAEDEAAPLADHDADLVQGALVSAHGLPTKDARVLTNEHATGAAIRSWLAEREGEGLTPNDTVVVFFSGRGAVGDDGKPYLLPHDASVADPQRGVALEDIARAINGAGAATILLDCAFVGRVSERGPGRTDRPPPAASEVFSNSLRVLAAAWDRGEATLEPLGEGGGAGLFTAHLLAALRGERQVDADRNGVVTLGEAFDHLVRTIEPRARQLIEHQRPVLLSGDPRQPLIGGSR